LGCNNHVSPSGSSKAALMILREKAEDYAIQTSQKKMPYASTYSTSYRE
jgi:hypothetical protein